MMKIVLCHSVCKWWVLAKLVTDIEFSLLVSTKWLTYPISENRKVRGIWQSILPQVLKH